MSIERAVFKYMDVIKSDIFTKYEKEFAHRIISSLSEGYIQKLLEPSLVQVIEYVVNGIDGLKMKGQKNYFELSTKSIFIHGNKSQVKFDYYGQEVQRELGDLIFIVSVIFNGQKYFEKITINQFKRDSNRGLSWNISNKEQLYLLSRFPNFRGFRGSIIPMREHVLPNHSKCLGSYGLLYKPGDFAFVSAIKLESFLGPKKTLKLKELYNLTSDTEYHQLYDFQQFHPYMELFYSIEKIYRYIGISE